MAHVSEKNLVSIFIWSSTVHEWRNFSHKWYTSVYGVAFALCILHIV